MRQKVCENPYFHVVVPATCKNNKITKKIKIKNPKCPPPVDPPSPPPAVVIAGTGSVRGGRHCHRPPSLLDLPAPPPHCSHRWSRIRMRRQPLLLPEPTVPRTGSMRGGTAAAASVVVGSVAPPPTVVAGGISVRRRAPAPDLRGDRPAKSTRGGAAPGRFLIGGDGVAHPRPHHLVGAARRHRQPSRTRRRSSSQ